MLQSFWVNRAGRTISGNFFMIKSTLFNRKLSFFNRDSTSFNGISSSLRPRTSGGTIAQLCGVQAICQRDETETANKNTPVQRDETETATRTPLFREMRQRQRQEHPCSVELRWGSACTTANFDWNGRSFRMTFYWKKRPFQSKFAVATRDWGSQLCRADTSNCKIFRHFSIENHHSSVAILKSSCVFKQSWHSCCNSYSPIPLLFSDDPLWAIDLFWFWLWSIIGTWYRYSGLLQDTCKK